MESLTLTIGGMSCQHCVRAVTEALEATPGVVVGQVAVGSATLQFDPAQTSIALITGGVEAEGYSVRSTSPSTGRVLA